MGRSSSTGSTSSHVRADARLKSREARPRRTVATPRTSFRSSPRYATVRRNRSPGAIDRTALSRPFHRNGARRAGFMTRTTGRSGRTLRRYPAIVSVVDGLPSRLYGELALASNGCRVIIANEIATQSVTVRTVTDAIARTQPSGRIRSIRTCATPTTRIAPSIGTGMPIKRVRYPGCAGNTCSSASPVPVIASQETPSRVAGDGVRKPTGKIHTRSPASTVAAAMPGLTHRKKLDARSSNPSCVNVKSARSRRVSPRGPNTTIATTAAEPTSARVAATASRSPASLPADRRRMIPMTAQPTAIAR
jgi:hypothetical protein